MWLLAPAIVDAFQGIYRDLFPRFAVSRRGQLVGVRVCSMLVAGLGAYGLGQLFIGR